MAQIAQEEKIIDKVRSDLGVWMDVFKADPEVKEFLYNPLANVAEKRGLIGDVVAKAKMQDYTANFLNLLVDMGRFEALDEIAEVFEEEIMKMSGTRAVLVRSAVELDDDAMLNIATKMKQISGVKEIKMKQELDRDLLAGFVVEMGDEQIDMSLKNELEMLKTEMIAGSAVATV